ncbi:MAG: LarC family nickel insertion protein, partial [Candidatus Wallbacteria bacterium]|nr:LarC family nickel insertion protein [Candidatus Wallbacteria bacterium]
PATLEVLKGVPCRPGLESGEVTTPTGAAFIAVMAKEFGDMPAACPRAVGYGAGTRQGERLPNLLRAVIAESSGAALFGEIVCLEANLDDMSPQFYGYLIERLFDAGALDVYLTPIQMKKNRPGTQVSVLGRAWDIPALREIVFAETPTLGVRCVRMDRWELPRSFLEVETRFGKIKIKTTGSKMAPEFEDCAAAARAHKVPIGEVFEEALRRARDAAGR